MAAVQEEILEQFFKRLGEHENFTNEIIQDLRMHLSGTKRAKPVDIEKALSPEEKEDEL